MSRIFIITGTRKGIGKALALHYLNRGEIVCGCSRKESSIQHANYRHFCLDVSDEKAVVTMVRSVKKEFGKIDVLLNNAGMASMNHILTTPFSSVQKIFSTNVFGSFLFIREVAKVMTQSYRASKQAGNMPFRIVNFSTVAVALRLQGEAIYASSKAALVSLTQICAKELAPSGITVNAVAPTPVQTDLIKNVPQNKIDELLNQQTIKRFGEFEDVLNAIDFFIQPQSDFITAQVLQLGGVNG